MKKILVGTIAILAILLLVGTVKAESIDIVDDDIEIHVNDSDNSFIVDIKITGKDVEVREDVYGTANASEPKDLFVQDLEERLNPEELEEIRDLCNDPVVQEYFKTVGSTPPQGFINYLKALGYDDETHISFVWTLCQHEEIVGTQEDLAGTQEELGELKEDIYGTQTGSGPEDLMIGGMEEGAVLEICDDPEMQQYFDELSLLPPDEFREHMKELGYDDETHVNMIWNLCQHKYIKEHEKGWSIDTVDGGILAHELVGYIEGAISWLKGSTQTPEEFKEIGTALASFFATKAELFQLRSQVYNDLRMLDIRVRALEKTMEQIAAEAYCQGKIDVMMEYNLSSVKCGEESTWYYNMGKKNGEGDLAIGVTPGDSHTPPITPDECVEKWVCSDWSDCKDGKQFRICVDMNECDTTNDKPTMFRSCVIEPTTITQIITGGISEIFRKGRLNLKMGAPKIHIPNIQLPSIQIPSNSNPGNSPPAVEMSVFTPPTPQKQTTQTTMVDLNVDIPAIDLLNILSDFWAD